MTLLEQLPLWLRILLILLLAVAGHLVVQGLRRLGEWVLTPASAPGARARDLLARRHPKVATVTSLVVSALTFVIYFGAFGLVLNELEVPLATYLATASVVGLAVAFGLQGLIQDVVIGITLVFSDTFDVGDMIEVSGQVGRVEKIGLRFTRLVNLHGQAVFIPNRNIAMVARYRRGAIRAYVDVQIPPGAADEDVHEAIERIAKGMRAQHGSILVTDPEILGPETAGSEGWRYLRVKFRLWPGQGTLLETVFRQRVVAAMREIEPGFAEWMVSVTYRA